MSRTTIQKQYYRNRQLRERVPLRNGQRHGIVRIWHKNGQVAAEEPYQNGLRHGIGRQWNDSGKLLGQYEMTHGTGVVLSWHDNGKPQSEISTVEGRFCGRTRLWLRDGTLIADDIYLAGRKVTAATYRKATGKDKKLPELREESAHCAKTSEKHIYRVFISGLLEKENRREARAWFQEKKTTKATRSLGRFEHEEDAMKFVEKIYAIGAARVIVPDIYRGKDDDQFTDGLLVEIPGDRAKRMAIRKVCARLRQQKLGTIRPQEDIGESHLYLSMS